MCSYQDACWTRRGGFVCVSPPRCHMRSYPLSIFQVHTHTSPIEHTTVTQPQCNTSGTIASPQPRKAFRQRTPARSSLIALTLPILLVVHCSGENKKKKGGWKIYARCVCAAPCSQQRGVLSEAIRTFLVMDREFLRSAHFFFVFAIIWILGRLKVFVCA